MGRRGRDRAAHGLWLLASGVKKAVAEQGWLGVMTGGLSATAGGIAAAVCFAVVMALLFRPGDKR